MKDNKISIVSEDKDYFIFECPNCEGVIIVYKKEINCAIFRHGIMKRSGLPMNPHTSQKECGRLIREKEIHGCGLPLKFIYNKKGKHTVEKCAYI
jgi:hypothetical protein